MKANDIIKAMCYDAALAEYGDFVRIHEEDDVKDFVLRYFGAFKISAGELSAGSYLAVWECFGDMIEPFQNYNVPDVVLKRIDGSDCDADDRHIWLWRIEK